MQLTAVLRKNGLKQNLYSTRQENIKEQELSFQEVKERQERRRTDYEPFGYNIEKECLAVIEAATPFSTSMLEAGKGKGNFLVAWA
jgi:hypothetical protein